MKRCPNCRRPIDEGDSVCGFCDEPIRRKDTQETNQHQHNRKRPENNRTPGKSKNERVRNSDTRNENNRGQEARRGQPTSSGRTSDSRNQQQGRPRQQPQQNRGSSQQPRQNQGQPRQQPQQNRRQPQQPQQNRGQPRQQPQQNRRQPQQNQRSSAVGTQPPKYTVPTGIKVICGLAVFGAIGSILGGVFLLDLASVRGAPDWLSPLGGGQIIQGVLFLVMVYGLWNLEYWGWKLAIALYSVNILSGLLMLAYGYQMTDSFQISNFLPITLPQIALAVIIIGYLYNKQPIYKSSSESKQRNQLSEQPVHQSGSNPHGQTPGTQNVQRGQVGGQQSQPGQRQQYPQGQQASGSGNMVKIGSAFVWMSTLSVLLFWLPALGPLIAGYVGGQKAGGVLNAVFASLIPAIALSGLAFSGGLLSDIPFLGLILGGATFVIMAVYVFPVLVGGVIGGTLAH